MDYYAALGPFGQVILECCSECRSTLCESAALHELTRCWEHVAQRSVLQDFVPIEDSE